MNLPICSRCKKYPAVVFVTRTQNGKPVQDGLCLKCARELKINPISDLLDRFGVSDDDIGHRYETWRAEWQRKGMPWTSHGMAPPPGWNASRQLEQLLRGRRQPPSPPAS